MKTMQMTMALRVVEYPNDIWGHAQQRLQQAWQCIEDGTCEWRDVPIVAPEILPAGKNTTHQTTLEDAAK